MNTYPDYQVRSSPVCEPSNKCNLSQEKNWSRVYMQVVIDTDKTTYSLHLQTQEQLDHMVNHINYALSRVFNNSIYA